MGGDTSENSAIGEVWQILPGSQEEDDNSLSDQMAQVIATDETSGDGIQQIIYVSYQDPDDPNQSRTLHFVDASMMRDKDESPSTGQSLPRLDVENDEIMPEQPQVTTNNTSADRIDMELAESDLQLQITDEEGNPIPLSIQDARQLLSQGQFVSQISEGQAIRVHSGVIPQELAGSLSVHVNQDTEIETVNNVVIHEGMKNTETMSTVQTDAEAIVKALEDEDTDATTVAAINQMGGEEQTEIADGEQAIEFTTQDGQKVRLVTSYHVDPMQLASEYLTIV